MTLVRDRIMIIIRNGISMGYSPDEMAVAILKDIRSAPHDGTPPRYALGQWSRSNIESFIDDALLEPFK